MPGLIVVGGTSSPHFATDIRASVRAAAAEELEEAEWRDIAPLGSLSNRGILVFGGSGGIGAAIARHAADGGSQVAITYSGSKASAEELADEIGAKGGKALALECDVADGRSIEQAFAEAFAFVPIDVVVFASGITGEASPLAEVADETLEKVIAVNLTGAMKVGREAIRRLGTAHGGMGGSVVFVSSRASHYGAAGEYVWYAASKGGLDSFVTGMAKEAAKENVRVNAVSPGPINTAMITPQRQAEGASRVPMQRVGEADEVAQAVMFLASPGASYITGANLPVSGGA